MTFATKFQYSFFKRENLVHKIYKMLGMDETLKFSHLTVKNEIVGKTERNEIDYMENHHTKGV
jgi:hypothetical protein